MIATSANFTRRTMRARSPSVGELAATAENRKKGRMNTPVASVPSSADFAGLARR